MLKILIIHFPKKKKKTYNSKNVFDTIFQIIYFKMLKKHNYMFGISMWFFIYKKVMIVCIVKEYYIFCLRREKKKEKEEG